MSATVTAKGWVINTTNTVYGMLEQGGVAGRRELISNSQLSRLGVTGSPSDVINDYGTTNEELVREALRQGLRPAKVIRTGHLID